MLPPSPSSLTPLTLPYYSATSIFPLCSPSLSPLWLYNAMTRGWLSNWNWKWNCCKNKKSERKEMKHIKRVEGAGKYASTVPLQRVLSVVPARESGLPWKPYTASLPACQPACLPACGGHSHSAQCSVLSARTRCLLPVNTHTSRFSLRATHTSAALDEAARYKCKRWRGKKRGGGWCGRETTLWSAMQVKMYYGRRWTKVKWSKVNFITSLRVR